MQVSQGEVYTFRKKLQKKIGPINTRNPPPFKLSKRNIDSEGESASFITAVCSRYAKRSLPDKKTSRMTLSFNSAFIPFKICSGKI